MLASKPLHNVGAVPDEEAGAAAREGNLADGRATSYGRVNERRNHGQPEVLAVVDMERVLEGHGDKVARAQGCDVEPGIAADHPDGAEWLEDA